MKKWNSSTDVLSDIQATFESLRTGELAVDQAHAAARLLGGAVRTLDTMLEHARLTGRLAQGSDVLPGFVVGDQK